jgi:NAD(P)-dependent dehydrogenase (short-subunit alcohol dehydrogenase family)
MSLTAKTIVGTAALFMAAGFLATVAARSVRARYSLSGRVVMVTGGSRGLGLLLARQYAHEGAKMVLIAREPSALERACREIQDGGAEVMGIACDVTDGAQVAFAISEALARFGKIDMVVNNVRASHGRSHELS